MFKKKRETNKEEGERCQGEARAHGKVSSQSYKAALQSHVFSHRLSLLCQDLKALCKNKPHFAVLPTQNLPEFRERIPQPFTTSQHHEDNLFPCGGHMDMHRVGHNKALMTQAPELQFW